MILPCYSYFCGASGKEPTYQCRRPKRHGFDLCVGKIRWRSTWQLTWVFLHGESNGQRSLVGEAIVRVAKESDTTEATSHRYLKKNIFFLTIILSQVSKNQVNNPDPVSMVIIDSAIGMWNWPGTAAWSGCSVVHTRHGSHQTWISQDGHKIHSCLDL